MGKLVVTEFISLDGVIEDPGGSESHPHGGWAFLSDRGDEGNRYKFDELMAADAQILGRVTYQGFAAAWPNMNQDDFGRRMNGMPKYVVSTTLTPETATWTNTTIITGDDIPGQIRDAKSRHQGDLLLAGSGTLARYLAERGLVDEYHLMMFPLVLGSGKRLFPDGGAYQRLRLTGHREIGEDRVQVLTYQPLAG